MQLPSRRSYPETVDRSSIMTEHDWNIPEPAVLNRVRTRLEASATEATEDVLATIVSVEGNAYRRPGAKMLFAADGTHSGSLTPGCLEDALQKAAADVRDSGTIQYVTYDMMEDDDVWGLGIGCHGIIDVLLEPLTAQYQPAVDAFANREDIAVITVIDSETGVHSRGDRAYYDPVDDRFTIPAGGSDNWPADALADPARKMATHGRSTVLTITYADADLTVFIDGVAARPELVIFGSGHDVEPVTELAAKNEFHVTVVGFRGGIPLSERFPYADETYATSPGSIEDVISLHDRTYAVVMTHNFVDDLLTIETLLNSPAAYIGLMGPRERFEQLLGELSESGATVTASALDRVYTPIGLNLGGGSPYQIAHSIVAELLAVHNEQEPAHLQSHAGPIHGRVAAEILKEDS